MINIDEIMKVLPHRYPMLLVDRILEAESGKSIRALKNVTINEAYFQGHYPNMPVMPGVLILESMAQAGAALMLTDPNMQGRMPLVGAFDNVRFKRPVVPGDQLITQVEVLWFRGEYGKIKATATVDGEIAASMEAAFKLVSGY